MLNATLPAPPTPKQIPDDVYVVNPDGTLEKTQKIAQPKPMTWTKELAEHFLETYAKISPPLEDISKAEWYAQEKRQHSQQVATVFRRDGQVVAFEHHGGGGASFSGWTFPEDPSLQIERYPAGQGPTEGQLFDEIYGAGSMQRSIEEGWRGYQESLQNNQLMRGVIDRQKTYFLSLINGSGADGKGLATFDVDALKTFQTEHTQKRDTEDAT